MKPTPSLPVLRQVHLALIAGVIALGGLFGALVATQSPQTGPRSALLLFAALLAVGFALAVAQAYVHRAAVKRARQAMTHASSDPAARRARAATSSAVRESTDTPEPALMQAFAGQSITRAAMAEAFTLFGLIVFYISHAWYVLLAPAVGLTALLLLFPTADKLERFADQAREPA